MSDELKLGQLITGEQRDAIHVAVAPVVAATALQPGLSVGLDEQGRAAFNVGKHVGVVDPFLRTTVKEGQRFWLFLFPNTVTGMRHEWSHPAFGDSQPVTSEKAAARMATAKAWLQEFSIKSGRDYDVLLEIGRDAIESGSGCHVGDDDDSRLFNDSRREFLKYVAIVLDLDPLDDPEDVYFSCAC